MSIGKAKLEISCKYMYLDKIELLKGNQDIAILKWITQQVPVTWKIKTEQSISEDKAIEKYLVCEQSNTITRLYPNAYLIVYNTELFDFKINVKCFKAEQFLNIAKIEEMEHNIATI